MPGWNMQIKSDTFTPLMNKIRNNIESQIPTGIEQKGRKMESYAKRIAPKDTGYMASTIAFAKLGLYSYVFQVTADYASYVEYGTSKMNAQPFMRPTVKKFAPELTKSVRDSMFKGT